MAIEKLEIGIDLETGQVTGQFKKIEDAGKKTAQNLGSSFKTFFLAQISAQALVGAFNSLKNSIGDIFSKGIKGAIDQQDSINKLNIALASSGQYSAAASKDLQDYASSLQNVTKFGDESILKVSALIQSLGKLDKEGLKTATKAALDLSTALGIDVNSAATLVAKAAGGNVSTFSRYGIAIKTGATASETFANALKKINDQFGGSSEQAVKTFSGAVTQFNNSLGDTFEAIGRFIIESPSLIKVFNIISGLLNKLTGDIDNFRGNKDFLKPIILGMIDFALAIDKYMVQPASLVGKIFVFTFDLIKIQLQRLLTGTLGSLSKFFGFLGEKFDVFKGLSSGLNDAFTSSDQVLAQFQTNAKDSLQAVGDQFTNTFGEDKKSELTSFFDNMRTQVEATNPTVQEFKNNVIGSVVEINKSMEDMAKTVQSAFKQGVVDVIAEGATRIGASLNVGAAAFDDFLKTVLGIIGDMAISIGKTLIGVGIGIEALRDSLVGLTGGQAIAAGLALVAIGGLLKSLSGGKGASSAASKSQAGGGIGTDQTQRTGVAQPDSIREQDKKTQVQLIVNGDVLDSEETGTRIVKLLNDSFQNRGTVLTGAKFA